MRDVMVGFSGGWCWPFHPRPSERECPEQPSLRPRCRRDIVVDRLLSRAIVHCLCVPASSLSRPTAVFDVSTGTWPTGPWLAELACRVVHRLLAGRVFTDVGTVVECLSGMIACAAFDMWSRLWGWLAMYEWVMRRVRLTSINLCRPTCCFRIGGVSSRNSKGGSSGS